MQDDIADAARWAITEGIADPQRICLAGGGYGGYATLMGLGRDPALFRCGIAWSSIPDLRELKDEVNWWLDDDLRNSNEQYTLAMLLGDADKDKALLRENSPRHLPARISAPLLMAHGYTDHIVPMSDARALFDAIHKTNAHALWMEYGEEGHDWVLPQTHVDFWQQSEKFLDRHIGKNSAAAKKE
ncbi:Prolyl oligopeptidase family protein [compost metagenome]